MRKLGFLLCEYEEGEDDVGFERLLDVAEAVAFTVPLKQREIDLNGGCGGGGREGRLKDETDAERVSMEDDRMKNNAGLLDIIHPEMIGYKYIIFCFYIFKRKNG